MNFEKKINNELKHETGFPGRPKKSIFWKFTKCCRFSWFNGYSIKKNAHFIFFRAFFTMSYFPFDIPPEVIKIS